MRFGRILLALASLSLARPALSQIDIYGDFSAAHVSTPSGVVYLYGPTGEVSATVGKAHSLMFGGVLRASYLGGSGQSFAGIAVGPEVARQIWSFTPHAEFLVGFARYNPNSVAVNASTDAQIQGAGGLDRKMSRRIDWRIVDFSYTQFYELGDRIHPLTFSTGLVFHLGSQ